MSINNPIISVKNLHKSFKLPHEQHSGIKQRVVNVFKGIDGYDTQNVLKDISFEIVRGEFFGIVGQNGSGKSTLLKLLAGIYTPEKGIIDINGSLTPFIELGVGFNPELTGRENIYMNGALLGMSRKEVDVIYDEIVSFAELEKFMDQKLKNYSSGMQVRLAFSIAIRSKSEILLFDEVLAVGDASFQQKCYETFSNMKDSGRTIVLVTHDMSAVQRFCEKAILIDNGKITLMGKPSLIADRYLEQNYEDKDADSARVTETKTYAIKDVAIEASGSAKKSYELHEEISVGCIVENYNPTPQPLHVGFQIFNNDGAYIFGTNSLNAGLKPLVGRSTKIKIKLTQNLGPGTYNITLAVMNSKATKVLKYQPKMASFNIKQGTKLQGIAILGNEWSTDV